MDTPTWQFIGTLVAIGTNLTATVYFLARMQVKIESLETRLNRIEDNLRQDIRNFRKDLADVIRRIDQSRYVPKTWLTP